MNRNIVETITGAVVILVALLFLLFARDSVTMVHDSKDSYKIEAKFDNADGIIVGSDIRIGGIKVGFVSKQWLEDETYLAALEFSVHSNVKLPVDSSAQIVSSGLLGNKYIAIVPGTENDMLTDKSTIKFTQSSVNLENLIGKFMFNGEK